MVNLFMIFLGFVNLVFGLGIGLPMLYFGLGRSRKRKKALTRVQQVQGEIVTAEVDRRLSNSSGRQYEYQPVIEFAYEFDGTRYTSNRRAYNMLFGATSQQRAQQTVEEYPVGTRVSVYVDPQEPEHGFLDIEATRQKAVKGFLTIVGGVMAFFGVVGLGVMLVGLFV